MYITDYEEIKKDAKVAKFNGTEEDFDLIKFRHNQMQEFVFTWVCAVIWFGWFGCNMVRLYILGHFAAGHAEKLHH